MPDNGGSIVRCGVGDRSPAAADPSIAHFDAPLGIQLKMKTNMLSDNKEG